MRPEKQSITKEYLARLNASPFFILVNYKGLNVAHFTELRKRLSRAGAELHVVKNSIFRIAAKEAGVGDLDGALAGQVAVVTGQRDISTAAKVVFWRSASSARKRVASRRKAGSLCISTRVCLPFARRSRSVAPRRSEASRIW